MKMRAIIQPFADFVSDLSSWLRAVGVVVALISGAITRMVDVAVGGSMRFVADGEGVIEIGAGWVALFWTSKR